MSSNAVREARAIAAPQHWNKRGKLQCPGSAGIAVFPTEPGCIMVLIGLSKVKGILARLREIASKHKLLALIY